MNSGRDLERRIASYLASQGYEVTTNAVVAGRSGGRHEIDVLAEKFDGVTTFRLFVECKQWGKPIEKDVVTKAAYVMNDLGLNKGIVVSLNGWRSGAETAANQLAMELWGPDELRRSLGDLAVGELAASRTIRTAVGWATNIDVPTGRGLIDRAARGRFGMGAEDVVWCELVWIPFFLLEMECSIPQKERFRRPSLATQMVWNVYEGLDGSLFARLAGPPSFDEVALPLVIQQLCSVSDITKRISRSMNRLNEVVRADAVARHLAELTLLGVPATARGIQITTIDSYFPFVVAFLQSRRGAQRILAVDAHWGQLREQFSETLTAHLPHVRECLTKAYQ